MPAGFLEEPACSRPAVKFDERKALGRGSHPMPTHRMEPVALCAALPGYALPYS
jgi:hypothetical protein